MSTLGSHAGGAGLLLAGFGGAGRGPPGPPGPSFGGGDAGACRGPGPPGAPFDVDIWGRINKGFAYTFAKPVCEVRISCRLYEAGLSITTSNQGAVC
jgi:hypothetical protein